MKNCEGTKNKGHNDERAQASRALQTEISPMTSVTKSPSNALLPALEQTLIARYDYLGIFNCSSLTLA